MDEPSRGILNHRISSATAAAPNTLSPTSSASASGPLSPTATQPTHAGIIRTESGTGSSGPDAPPTGITIQIKEPPEQRGRSRNKHSSSSVYGTSRSRTKSRSLSRLQIADPNFLKWTILNHDPSERLRRSNRLEVVDDDISDEEHISDVDNDYDLDAELDYDLGARVLPNFVVSIQKVMDAQSAWLAAYLRGPPKPPAPDVRTLDGPCKRALLHMSRNRDDAKTPQDGSRDRGVAGNTFVLYLEDLNTSCAEKLYALTYTFGAVLSQGDTLYVLVQCDVDDVELHIARVRDQVAYLLDCTSGVLDTLDVVLLALHHPYPRHLLTETLEAFQPAGLVVPLQIATGSLAGYVSFVPTLVVRKKLRRARRRGICD